MKNGYQIHTIGNTNAAAQAALEQVQAHYQFVPNALGAMAESPESVLAYLALDDLVNKNSLTSDQRHIAFLTITREYDCSYCVAAHTAFAQMGQVDMQAVQNVRDGKPLKDAKLEALRLFTTKMVQTGGNVSEADINTFLASGYTRRNILDIATMMANKLIAVFANRIMGTDLDDMLQPAEWKRSA